MATLAEAKRIVVKIGSALLVERSSGALRQNWLASFITHNTNFSFSGSCSFFLCFVCWFF